jgi:hypothetical protein
MGRPSLFNPHLAGAILSDLANGQFRKCAAIRHGIAYSTLRDWLREGKADAAAGEDTELADFWRKVERAEADAEWAVHVVVRARALEDARLGLDYLKVRNRKRWAPRQEVTGKGGKAIAVDVKATPLDLSKLSPDELEQAIRLAEKAQPAPPSTKG